MILSFLLPILSPLHAAQKNRLAILPFSADPAAIKQLTIHSSGDENRAEKSIDSYSEYLSEQFIHELSDHYDIVPSSDSDYRKSLKLLEKQMLAGCSDDCLVDIGNMTSARLLLSGDIKHSLAGYIISIKIFDAQEGKINYIETETAVDSSLIDATVKDVTHLLITQIKDPQGYAKIKREMEKARKSALNRKIDELKDESDRNNKVLTRRTFLRTAAGQSSFDDPNTAKYYTASNLVVLDLFFRKPILDWKNGLDPYVRLTYRDFLSVDLLNLPNEDRLKTVEGVQTLAYSGDFGLQYRVFGFKLLLPVIFHITFNMRYTYLKETSQVWWGDSQTSINHIFGTGAGAGFEIPIISTLGLWAEYSYTYEPVGNDRANIGSSQFYAGITLRK